MGGGASYRLLESVLGNIGMVRNDYLQVGNQLFNDLSTGQKRAQASDVDTCEAVGLTFLRYGSYRKLLINHLISSRRKIFLQL